MFTTLRRVAPAQTLPRGESGPEAGDGSAAQTCSSVLPPPEPTGASAGFVFLKHNTGISFRACPRSPKRDDAPARSLRRGFPYGVFRRDTLFCLHNEVSYPARSGSLDLRGSIRYRSNVTYSPEIIVRTKPGKIVAHYNRRMEGHQDRYAAHHRPAPSARTYPCPRCR